MKILVVCQNYFPEQFRITDICEGLVKRGHEVTVITGLPNYPEGKIFKGYKGKEKRDEIINGVKVHRCFTIGRRHGILFRFLNYYSFAISSVKYVKKIKEKYDIVFVNQLSPVMMAKAGIKYKKRYKVKLILYCLDLWPESLTAGGIKPNSIIYKHYKKVSEKIYKNANKILITSKSFSDYFNETFGIKDTFYLPQYAEDLFSVEKCKKTPNGYIDLLFAGNVGTAQSVKTIIEAARQTRGIDYLRWHIVGDGSELDNAKKLAEGLPNIFFYGRQPLTKMPEFYSKADAMLVTLQKGSALSYTLPGKVQSYMAAGKPILGSIDGETKRIIEESECGFCCEAENVQQFAEIVQKFIELKDKNVLSNNALQYYFDHFLKESFFDKLTSCFKG